MNILVTGAEGFIGSHLSEALVKLGHKVKCIVLYNSFNDYGWLDHIDKNIRKEIEICFGDIRDQSFVKKSMKKCDVVIHLAALIGIPYSYISPRSYVETNVMGTLNILQTVKELDISKLIHTSTSEVYGSAKFIPITEKHPLNGQSPYSASKIAADHLANSFYLSFNTPVVTLRPFNTYGPRQSNRAIIPTIITQILNNKILELGSLYPTRDFTYIRDTISGFVSIAENKKSIGQIINIGSGYEISIEDLVEVIQSLMKSNLKIKVSNMRKRPIKGEVFRLKANINKANKLLHWKPSFKGKKGLKEGLKETIEWFSRNSNLYKSSIYNK